MDLLNIEQLAEYLQCTVQTARKKMRDPDAPVGMNPAGRMLYDREEIDLWLISEREDKALIKKLSDEYDVDGDQPTPIQFLTNDDLEIMDLILSGQQELCDIDPEWLTDVLSKVNILAKLSSDTHVFGVTRAYRVANREDDLRGALEKAGNSRDFPGAYKPNYFDPAKGRGEGAA